MTQRMLLAIAGFGLLSVFIYSALQTGWQGASNAFFAAACGRVGLVTLAAAFAWPQVAPLVRKFPPWFWGTILFAGILVAVRPRLFLAAIGLVIAAVVIQGGIGWVNRHIFRGR